jgi:ATP-dependent protease HslVU (ClpYQ) peptidase subunit
MGCDSAGVAGWITRSRKDSKICKVGDFLIGGAGSFRAIQLINRSFTPPKHEKGVTTTDYMVNSFVESLRKLLDDSGCLRIYDSKTERFDANFLVAYKGKVFEIEADFQVAEYRERFSSIGCGSEFALGSLYSTGSWFNPERRVEIALEAADKFSGGVCKPFKIFEL